MKQQEIIVNVFEANQPSERALREFNQSFLDYMKKMENSDVIVLEDD